MHPRLQSGAFARPLNFTVRRNARDTDAPVRLNPRNSRIVFLCVCIALGALFLRFESWPFWVQSLLIVASIVTFPLMNSLGVLRQLGLENTPGSRFNLRHMLAGIAFFLIGGIWLVMLLVLVPNPSQVGVWLILVPAFMAWGAGLLFFVK